MRDFLKQVIPLPVVAKIIGVVIGALLMYGALKADLAVLTQRVGDLEFHMRLVEQKLDRVLATTPARRLQRQPFELPPDPTVTVSPREPTSASTGARTPRRSPALRPPQAFPGS